jgi:hypothetical protein
MVTHSYTTIISSDSLVTLQKAKKQLHIEDDFEDEDDLIGSYLDAAQMACENFINRGISKRNLVIELSAFETPLTFERNYENDSIEKIEYYAPGETELTPLPADQYQLRKSNIVECFDIKLLSKPATDVREDAVIITINQGFDLASCPKPIIQAINLRLSDFYERREDREQGNNPASNNLLRPYRKY